VSSPLEGPLHVLQEVALRKDPGEPGFDTPNFWYGEAWYLGFAVAGVFFALAVGLLALAGWTGLSFLMRLAAGVAFMGFIPLFGGTASLLRRLIGRRLLKRLVVATVVLIILACATFLVLVATRGHR
jgi:hypothetical protein